MYMIEKIFDRSRLWKEFMVERVGLPASRAQAGFVDIIVESGIEEKTFLCLCAQMSKKIGSYNFREINYLHTLMGYQVVLQIMCDSEVSPFGEVFWLEHPDYPEIVFEIMPAPMELYKVYVVDQKMAAAAKTGDSILLSVPDLRRIADIVFVAEIPEHVEAKRRSWRQKHGATRK